MSNNQLSKLVENLKNKIKKLENQTNTNTNTKTNKINEMQTYRIHTPISNNSSKKYVGLLFNNNYDLSSDITDSKDSISFIRLGKNNNIINYSITLKVDDNTKDNMKDNICTFSLGIRDGNNKIKIIKGSKVQYDINKDIVDGHIIINNTTLYEAMEHQELCLIVNISKKCILINKKSIIKILNL
jgi:hypothetical protein